MRGLEQLARNYRFLARQLRRHAQGEDGGTLSAQMLYKAAASYAAMADVARHIEQTTREDLPPLDDFFADDTDYASASNMSPWLWFGLAATFRRGPIVLFISLALFTAAAWGMSIYQADAMSAPMEMTVPDGATHNGIGSGVTSVQDWSLYDAPPFVAMWTVMMAAMMLPSIAPLLIVFVSIKHVSRQATAVPSLALVGGYLLIWGSVGLLAYLFLCIGDIATRLTPMSEHSWQSALKATTLIAAGLYQFTAPKRLCLRYCRSPHAFIVRHWRGGLINAFKLGLQHGSHCLGCCWLLFVMLTAVGLTSLAWMILLALLVVAEKVLPRGQVIAHVAGIALMIFGIASAAGISSA